MASDDEETALLIDQTESGSIQAREELFARHRHRLLRMVSIRLDRRLSARVDPSDVVQSTLHDASRKLDAFLRERPLPFYPWLHRLASEQIVQVHRHHLHVKARDVGREAEGRELFRNATARHLVDFLAASQTSPSQHLIREEQKGRLHRIGQLAETDCEILAMHYLEELRFNEIAAVLGITVGAAKVRHFRALERLRPLMDEDASGAGQ